MSALAIRYVETKTDDSSDVLRQMKGVVEAGNSDQYQDWITERKGR